MTTQLTQLTTETALTVFTVDNGLDPYVQQVKDEVNNFEHDLSTGAGRKRSASLAAKVAKIKIKLDNLGKDLVAEWKSNSKKVDGARKKMRDDLDELKVIARKPLTDWELEQVKIEEEKQLKLEAEMLVKEKENDHEIGLLLNEKFDRELADKKAKLQAEKKIELARLAQEKIDHEEQLKKEAAETARLQADIKAKENQQRIEQEKQEAIQREAQAKQAQLQAERDKIAAQEREKLVTEQAEAQRKHAIIDAEIKLKLQKWIDYISEAYEINAKVDHDRQTKWAAEQAETKRVKDIKAAKQVEISRQQEEIRIENKAAAMREADKNHKGKINRAILKVLLENGTGEKDAKTMIKLAAKGLLPNLVINY